MSFAAKKAIYYACDVLGISKRKITYCKKTGKGFSNDSFCLIVASKSAYHVRLAKNRFFIDRALEKEVMELVGFTFVDFDVKSGNYVRPWINGISPRFWSQDLLRDLVRTLKILHSTQPLENLKPFDPFFYDSRVQLPKKYKLEYAKLVAKNHFAEDFCLCHNDVHSANVVLRDDDSLVLIDYEWACLNNPLWELGNFIREERLSTEQMGVLLNEYGHGANFQTLQEFVFMASCYGWLWARCMPLSLKILKQRLRTFRDLRTSFKDLSLVF